ncbi:hypothetical protein CHLRE_02g081000v5 [Chlamydomonas reinhardtii]|uniref:Exonuclease domain-containing protein n=1 Tax=Chlamydomonas reinhardtii TaxID=3055 RepID=A0A2K3E0I3_CHLRE|nr:uncharacterized protein CHLRE_02g081000v5 [Chlamydomonas reinhardtii]PNW86302.1 hypothetical protein CHLRE_02g081000v5 [Chlamydomonas reinhardtii]
MAVLALDVEFTHLEPVGNTSGEGQQRSDKRRQAPSISVATWVAVVGRFGTAPPALKSYISLPPELKTQPCDCVADKENEVSGEALGKKWYRVVGGVREAALCNAPCLAEVQQQLLALLREGRCKVLVGHGISKDLQSLGIDEEADLRAHGVKTFDTMSFPKFQGRGGMSKALAVLAREFLGGRQIQTRRGAHDPEEDARAAMDLYVRHVDYDCMVEYETQRLLSQAAAAAGARHAVVANGCDGGNDGGAEVEEGIER